MRLVKKLSSIVASIIIILAIGGYVFVRNFDLNRYKPDIEDIVFNATGRVLKMEGNAQLAISLVPTVEINNVSLSNPTWAKNPNMAEMDKLEIKFAIMPLLKKQIVIDKLILHGTKIYLEKALEHLVYISEYENTINKKMCIDKSEPECMSVSNDTRAEIEYNNKILVEKNKKVDEIKSYISSVKEDISYNDILNIINEIYGRK